MVTLNIWICGSGPTVEKAIKTEVDIFEKLFSSIEVKVSIIPWEDAWSSIVEAANEQKGPDIIQIGSTWNATLAFLEVLRDITEQVSNEHMTGDFFVPACWSNCYFPGSERISSLPWFADIRAIYYRKDVFEDIGLSDESFSDWASFEKACESIKNFEKREEGLEVFGTSGQKQAILLHNIAAWIWGAGGDFLTPDNKQANFNNKETINGLEFYISLISRGYIPTSALKLKTEDINQEFFSKGHYAIAVPGPIESSVLFDPNSPLYAPKISGNCVSSYFPAGPEGRFIFCGGSNLAITNFSQHPKEAWEFIKFLISLSSQVRYATHLNMFPALLESFNFFFIGENPLWRGLRESWRYTRAFPNVPSWGAIESLLIECFGNIFARVKEGVYNMSLVRQDLDRTAIDVDELLAR